MDAVIEDASGVLGPELLPLLTVDEVAIWLGCSRRSVYAWAESGQLRHFKIGRLLRFSRNDVAAFARRATSDLFEAPL